MTATTAVGAMAMYALVALGVGAIWVISCAHEGEFPGGGLPTIAIASLLRPVIVALLVLFLVLALVIEIVGAIVDEVVHWLRS